MTRTASPPSHPGHSAIAPDAGSLVEALRTVLDDAKAEDIISLDLAGKTSLADAMIIASGRSDRHVGAIADRVAFALKERGLPAPRIEGTPVCDWVLIDAGDIIVHLFRPEVRGFYNLEKLWGLGRPQEGAAEDVVEKPKRRVIRTTNAAD
jgi:ribosome-associated protein